MVRFPPRMTTENNNGNIGGTLIKPTSSSTEDLSEYTDADESISAPTEFLAEFLSAVMLKDYGTALKYCKLILQYEPNNATAKEFYPLILQKLKQVTTNEEEGSNDSEDEESEDKSVSSSMSESESSNSDNSSEEQGPGAIANLGAFAHAPRLSIFALGSNEILSTTEEEEEEMGIENVSGGKQSKGSSDGGTTGSYSSLEDDEAEAVDQLAALVARYQIDNVNLGNGNTIYDTSNHPAPTSMSFQEKLSSHYDNSPGMLGTGNHQVPFGTSSDSESPTEPVSQQTVAMLRARVVPNKI